MPVKCPKCVYAKNSSGDRLCSLCGEVLGVGGGGAASKGGGPASKRGTDPGITEIPEPQAPAPAPAPDPAASASGAFSGSSAAAGGLCHLKCSLLERPLRMRPDRAVTIGRARECDISVPSQMVSRVHGKVEFDRGVWVYTDQKSSNGTRVNGKRVERVVLQSGDVIDVGGFMITYKEIHDLSDVSEVPEDQGKTMSFDPSMLKRAGMSGLDGVALWLQREIEPLQAIGHGPAVEWPVIGFRAVDCDGGQQREEPRFVCRFDQENRNPGAQQ